jgi:hypothetical protein
MLLFRSEEHIDRWCAQRRVERGAIFSLEQVNALARTWYTDKLSPEYRRKTAAEAQAAFEDVGLTGEFWRLA